MSQQVQDLIDKIQSEGIHEAEQKAKEIERQAREKGEKIVADAKQEADQSIRSAERESEKIKASTSMVLQQAARDTLLNLRKEIEATLMKIVSSEIHETLTSTALEALITETVKGYIQKGSSVDDITVTLSKKDLKKLKEGFITKLKDEIKKPISCRGTDDVGAGFTISFDQGKSCFDFTDTSLVECLSGYLNSEVADLLQKSVSG